MTPTARTLVLLRRRGYMADVAERWIPRANIRRDLFGRIDVAAVHPQEPGVLGVQATTAPHVSARVKKATALPALRAWLDAGNRFQVWGWRKTGQRWKVRIVSVQAGDMATAVLEAPRRSPGGRRPQQTSLFDP